MITIHTSKNLTLKLIKLLITEFTINYAWSLHRNEESTINYTVKHL